MAQAEAGAAAGGRYGPGLSERWGKRLAALVFILAFLGVWHLLALRLPPFLLPGPAEVARGLVDFLGDARKVRHMLSSFSHVGLSIAISFVIGAALALLPYYVPAFGFAVHRRLGPFLNSFSGIGWTLLAIMWFGVSPTTVVFTICAVLVPFALVNLHEGLRALDSELLEMSDSFTRSRWRQFRAVIFPGLYPFMFATLRIMFGVAWKVALTAELFGGNAGFGYLINLARQEFDTATIFVSILLIIAFVYGMDRLVFMPIQSRLARAYGGR